MYYWATTMWYFMHHIAGRFCTEDIQQNLTVKESALELSIQLSIPLVRLGVTYPEDLSLLADWPSLQPRSLQIHTHTHPNTHLHTHPSTSRPRPWSSRNGFSIGSPSTPRSVLPLLVPAPTPVTHANPNPEPRTQQTSGKSSYNHAYKSAFVIGMILLPRKWSPNQSGV